VLLAGLQILEAKCQAVVFAILLLDGLSQLAARYAVHQHRAANLDSFRDYSGFLPAILEEHRRLHEARQLRTQRVTHAFWAALFVATVFWLEGPLPRA
jgi:hypothetical protein